MDASDRSGGLIAWQWRNYARNHRNRGNLLVHMFAVPLFIASVLASIRLATLGFFVPAGAALVFAVLAFALQGFGHKREAEPPVPFKGPFDFLARVFVEQFITFPRFVLTGGWSRHLAGRFDA